MRFSFKNITSTGPERGHKFGILNRIPNFKQGQNKRTKIINFSIVKKLREEKRWKIFPTQAFGVFEFSITHKRQ